jgi:hypothetical protein
MANTERNSRLRCACGTISSASEVNTGVTILPPISSRAYIIVGGWLKSTTSAATATSVDLIDTTDTHVHNVVVARGNLTNGTMAPLTASSGVTWTTFGVANTKGKGIKIASNDGALSGTTVLDYCIEYMTI